MENDEKASTYNWKDVVGAFSKSKYVLRVKSFATNATIPEAEENASSSSKSIVKDQDDSSTSSTDTDSPVSHRTISSSTTTSRMENGEKFPRLAAGLYHKQPTPILGTHIEMEEKTTGATLDCSLPLPSECVPEMRGPPPAWQPPRPPGEADTVDDDYENNYEDPQDLTTIQNATNRDLLLVGPPPIYNSYEMSLSQQRRSNAMSSSCSDWMDEPHRVLHKTSDGAYYVPTGTTSVRTTTSTLSPVASQSRYTSDQCAPMPQTSVCNRAGRSDPSTTSLLKYNTTASLTGTHINKRRSSKMPTTFNEKEPVKPTDKKLSPWFLFLALSLLLSLIIIVLLLFRSPYYVYSSPSPSSTTDDRISLDESQLRPLPAVISLGQRVEADIVPKHVATTEIFISRASRVRFNVSLSAGSQMVLLGRHSVPPSLYLHDFFRPIKADQPVSSPSHTIEQRRFKRHQFEIVDARTASVDEFLLEGRWHLMLINERNRVEPILISTSVVPSPVQTSSEDIKSPLRCEQDCSGHGECVSGKCKCVSGYTGDACEDSVCPIVCSGHGVFSGGKCVCGPGFKGKECELRSNWCEVPNCNGNGICASGACRCNAGWTGSVCEKRECSVPGCNNNGVCQNGICYCSYGWTGHDCSARVPIAESSVRPLVIVAGPEENVREEVIATQQPARTYANEGREQVSSTAYPDIIEICSSHGRLLNGECDCDHGWQGPSCENKWCPNCLNGLCTDGICSCYKGWTGSDCDRQICPHGCQDHGICNNNGTCSCQKGWNSDNCYIQGCRNNCSDGGDCVFSPAGWKCSCQPGRTGEDCSIRIETDCNDGLDNDSDDLIDCEDPECCSSDKCQDRGACVFTASPDDVIIRLHALKNAPFAQKVAFIYQNDIQKYADATQFNESLVSLVRGRIVWEAGTTDVDLDRFLPLVGVRVSDSLSPLWGFTLSRLDGQFDLVVNGGQTVQLRFQRNPFSKLVKKIYVPPNEMFNIGDIKMYHEKRSSSVQQRNTRSQCSLKLRAPQSPIIKSSWEFGTDGFLQSGMMVDTRNVVERIPIPGSSAFLVYDSLRVAAANTWIVIGLLGDELERDLRIVHVKISVGGRLFENKLAPRVNLTHVFSWDKHNLYRQGEYGPTVAHIRIGYEYKDCDRENEIVWLTRNINMMGGTARRMEGAAWTLSIHHYLDVVNSVVEMGDGGVRVSVFGEPSIETVVGTASKRELQCANCEGIASQSSLFRPSSLAFSTDGSLYIADHDLIRRVSQNGNITTVFQLSTSDTSHSYHLAVNPLDGSLYVSLSLRKQIIKITTPTNSDVTNNYEIIAGDGTTCPSSSSACGDGGPATEAQLMMPKGISFDGNGNLFVADGRRIRFIESSGTIRSVGDYSSDKAPLCSSPVNSLADLQMEWPTSVSVDLLSGSVYVLDSNIVYQLNQQQQTSRIVLGGLSACKNQSNHFVSNIKDISVYKDGSLLIVESDGKQLNQIRRLSSDGSQLSLFAGQTSVCSCDVPTCGCDDSDSFQQKATQAKFNAPMAITVSTTGDVYVSDTGNAKVRRIYSRLPDYDPKSRLYTIVDADENEVYAFNRHGLHLWTQSINTAKILYNFTYNVDTSLGKLSSVHGSGDLLLRFMRPNETHTTIETPNGERTHLKMSMYDGTLETVKPSHIDPIKLHYSSGGLLLNIIQGGNPVAYSYDQHGRAISVKKDSEIFEIQSELLIGNRYVSKISRNGQAYAILTSLPKEVILEADTTTKLLTLDEGYMINSNGMSSLLDSSIHPVSGQWTVTKKRTTIPAIQIPSRRQLTHRFDWRPYTKKGEDRKLAEVGTRPRVNGVNLFSVSYNRESGIDTVRSRTSDEVLFTIHYADNGDVKMIAPGPEIDADSELKLPTFNITHDSVGRLVLSEFGSLSIKTTFDRQHRIVEKKYSGGMVEKYSYIKENRSPNTVEYGSGIKYQLKYDTKGGLKEVVTPIGEVHSFSMISIGSESILSRRYPFTKKPFRLRLNLPNTEVLEWISADETRQMTKILDIYGKVKEYICDSTSTSIEYDEVAALPHRISSMNSNESSVWQGTLLISRSQSLKTQHSLLNSAISLEYDDHLRLTSMQAFVNGASVEPTQFTFDDRTSLMNGLAGYQMLREMKTLRIQGHKTHYEVSLDNYRRISAMKAKVGDVSVSVTMERDAASRVVKSEWKTSSGKTIKDVKSYDARGIIVSQSTGDQRWQITYNHDGRPVTSGEIVLDWHSGGVPKRAGTQEYSLDGNGWVIKRGTTSFEYDCIGRLVRARNGKDNYRLMYDYMGRVSWIQSKQASYYLVYGNPSEPNQVTHFTSTGAGVATICYMEDGRPFAMSRDGYRYAIVTEENKSLRYVLSETDIVKETVYNPFGSVASDSAQDFWIPIGFRGGLDIPDISISILNSRPLDTVTGRYLSFGPNEISNLSMDNIFNQLDLFSATQVEDNRPKLPADLSTWLGFVGMSSKLFSTAELPALSSPVSTHTFSTFPSKYSQLSLIKSVQPSQLLPLNERDTTKYAQEEASFNNLFIITSHMNTTVLTALPTLSVDDHNLLTIQLKDAEELPIRLLTSNEERHFIRKSAPVPLLSESRAHFTMVSSAQRIEIRSGKSKIIIHIGEKEDVLRTIIDELRRRDGPLVWRSEKRRLERADQTSYPWTDEQKKELLSQGSVSGYQLLYKTSYQSRFDSINRWYFERV